MSEQRPPNRPGDGHPDEALVAFTDGSATADERALVLAHLQGCTTCRHDVEIARRGLDALAALPEPEAPTLDPESIVRRAGNVVGIEAGGGGAAERAGRRSRVVIGGLASGLVAAGIVFVLATGAIKLGGGGVATTASGGEAGGVAVPVAPSPAASGTIDLGKVPTDFSRDGIDQLAADEAKAAGGKNGATLLPTSGAQNDYRAALPRAQLCTGPQTADGSTAISVVLAHFEGRPVFVAVLRNGEPGQGFVRVVVTERTTCSVLYSALAPVPHG